MNTKLRLKLHAAVIGLLAMPATAYATDAAPAPAAAEETGGDIVVTAQRREQSLQDTPVAVSAFNQEMLNARGVTSVMSIAASTPGLLMSPGTASPSTINISMRGALEQNGGTITSESPVAIYIDDVYQSRLSAANYDLADIERVEVLRGPQGTLYGRNSMTGAIKLITRQPDGRTWLNTDVSFARFDEVRAKVSAGAPLSDNIAAAFSGFYDERFTGWQYNETTGKDVSKYGRWGVQMALGLTNVDNVEAVLTGRYINSKSDGQYFQGMAENYGNTPALAQGLPFYHTRTPLPANGDNESYSVSLKLGYDFGGVKLRSITAYQHLKERWALDFAGGTYKFLNPVTFSTDLGSTAGVGFYRDSPGRQHQVTEELQLLGKGLDDKLNYIVGAFFFDEKAYQYTMGDIYLGFPSVPSDIDTTSRSLAVYTQVDYEFVPSLTASVGIRYTHDKKTFFGHTPDAFGTLHELSYGLKANVWTPKFNLQWKVTDDAMVYGTVAKGYRSGGFNSLNSGLPDYYGKPYLPETAWSYELGAKFDLLDHRATLNIAAYMERLSELQTLAFGPTPGSFFYENAAKAEVKGLEVETTLRPTGWLRLFGNFTYTDDKYLKVSPGTAAALTDAKRLPLISRVQYQVGGTATIPAGEGSVDVSADWNYRSHYFSLTAITPDSYVPSIGRANASVTYKLPGDQWEVYAQATNLFDSKDYSTSSEFVAGVFGYRIPLEPRVWRVGFRYKM